MMLHLFLLLTKSFAFILDCELSSPLSYDNEVHKECSCRVSSRSPTFPLEGYFCVAAMGELRA
jgi:hypothetical protein